MSEPDPSNFDNRAALEALASNPLDRPRRAGFRDFFGRLGIFERSWTPPVFFVLTVGTVFFTGVMNAMLFYEGLGQKVAWSDRAVLLQGLAYMGGLIAILGTHEMGHWLVARWHGVKTSLPVFIPIPFGIGTFGAVIAMKELPPDRRSLLRIGAAGPLAGGVVALALMALAIPTCPLIPPEVLAKAGPDAMGTILGDSLGMKLLQWLVGGQVVSSDRTLASPIFLAAWTGFLLTSINLFPIGQLDGGHIAFAIFGQRMNRIARFLALGVMSLAFFGSPTWLVWGLLSLAVSRHPPVPFPEEKLPLDAWILAAASLVLFALTFMLVPIRIVGG